MKKEMTDDLRRKLSGLLPFAPGSSLPFTPEAFQKVEEAFRPRFFLTRFPVAVQKEIERKIASATLDREAVVWSLQEGGCVSWENMYGLADGEDIHFSKVSIDTLPDPTLWACFWKCAQFTGMTPEEKEALELPQPSALAPSSNLAPSADAPPA